MIYPLHIPFKHRLLLQALDVCSHGLLGAQKMEQEHVQDRGAASDHLNRGILANSVVGPKHQTPELQVHTYPKMLHESSGKVVKS